MTIPSTPTCKVLYKRDGITYFIGLKTPPNAEVLKSELTSRGIDLNSVMKLEPINPPQVHRGHPAANQLSKYMAMSD